MADWNPALYTRFEDERTRPAAENVCTIWLSDITSCLTLTRRNASMLSCWNANRIIHKHRACTP